MTRTLILGGRDATTRSWYDMHGRPLLERYPGPVLLFVDAQSRDRVPQPANCAVEGIEYQSQAQMLELARRWHAKEGITAVGTLDERSVEFAAVVRAELGLPGMRPELAAHFRDKVTMKRILGAAGIRVPEFCAFADREATTALLRRHGKLVVKPRDGLGSRNVEFVSDEARLDKLAKRLRDPQNYEAEEFITGTLYHTNSIVIGGQVRFTAVAPYLPGMANIDFSEGTPFVSHMLTEGPLYERLCTFSEQAIHALGMTDGITHMELFHSDADEIVFCETAARPGGGGIVHMIEAQYGVNMSLAALLCENGRGEEALAGLRNESRRFGLVGVRNAGMGRVELRIDDRTFAWDWMHHLQLDVQADQFRPPSAHCTDFLGLAIIDAPDEGEFRRRMDQFQRRFDDAVRLAPV